MDSLELTEEEVKLAEEIFNMVYGWGKFGVGADVNSPAFKNTIEELVRSANLRGKGDQ